MLEETGYVVDSFVKMPTPVLYYDPWKSNESCYNYAATVNGDDPESFKGQKLSGTEHIKTVKFVIDEELLEKMISYCKEHNLKLESKVYTFCIGLQLKSMLGTI